MNKIALHSFSGFDISKGVAADDDPERFYHGFVLGLMVELAGRFEITSNRESGEECLDEITVCHFRISAKPALYHSTKHSSDFKVRDGQRVPDINLPEDLRSHRTEKADLEGMISC